MGTMSAICSTVRSWTRSCGPRGSARPTGRTLLSASSSSSAGRTPGASVAVARRTPHAPPPMPLPFSDLVLRLGKGQCDAQAFVPLKLLEPSLPPSSGCAFNASLGRQPETVFVSSHTEKGQSCGKTAWVVVVVVVSVDTG